jgi:hypothetical protein
MAQHTTWENWPRIWWAALTEPTEAGYRRLLHWPRATSRLAFGWIYGMALVNLLIQAALRAARDRPPDPDPWGGTAPVVGAICAPGLAVFMLIGYMAWVGAHHFVARSLGGQGRYDALAWLLATFTVPLGVALGVLSAWPLVQGVVSLYSVFLTALAIRTVYRLDWAGTLVATLWWLPLIVAGGALAVVAGVLA